jgi:hypothetical protein
MLTGSFYMTGSMNIDGGLSYNYTGYNAAATIKVTDHVVAFNSNGDYILTIPDSSLVGPGKTYIIKNATNSGVKTVQLTGTDIFEDGTNSRKLSSVTSGYPVMKIIQAASNKWFILQSGSLS